MIVDKEWYLARKELLEQAKEQVALRLGDSESHLKSYYRSYQNEFKGRWRSSSYKELFFDIQKAKVILGGDFHAHAQSQRSHLRILRELPKSSHWALALECFEAKDQKILDQFLAKKIKEKEFLKKINWNDRWGFSWANYRPLVKLAMLQNIPIIAINKYYKQRTEETLVQRDIYSAQMLSRHQKKHKFDFIYVIFGDLHLSQNHLPEKVQKALKLKASEILCLLQNSERLYFQLARRGQEHQIEVLKGSKNRYCVIGSPPWVKWQNYLLYLDRHFECDLDEAEGELDYTDALKNQLEFLLKELKIKLSLNDLEVYTPKEKIFWKKVMKNLSLKDKKAIKFLIKHSRSFYLSKAQILCLSHYTMNQISEMAGQYIQAKLSERTKDPFNMPQDFTAFIWLEAVGYFMSKLVNHKRKAETLKSLKARLLVSHPKDRGKKALLLALDQRLCEILSFQGEVVFTRKFNPRDREIYLEAGRILGHMLGEKLFMAYRMENISKSDLVNILKVNVFSEDFSKKYSETVSRVENMDSPLSLGGLIYG